MTFSSYLISDLPNSQIYSRYRKKIFYAILISPMWAAVSPHFISYTRITCFISSFQCELHASLIFSLPCELHYLLTSSFICELHSSLIYSFQCELNMPLTSYRSRHLHSYLTFCLHCELYTQRSSLHVCELNVLFISSASFYHPDDITILRNLKVVDLVCNFVQLLVFASIFKSKYSLLGTIFSKITSHILVLQSGIKFHPHTKADEIVAENALTLWFHTSHPLCWDQPPKQQCKFNGHYGHSLTPLLGMVFFVFVRKHVFFMIL
jgi:hypothetical protein